MKNTKTNWWRRNALEIIMGLIAVFILIAVSIDYSFKRAEYKTLESIAESNKLPDYYKELIFRTNDSTIVYNNKEVFQLQKEIIELKKFNSTLKETIDSKNDTWLAYIANFWAILGLILGTIAVVFSFKEKVKDEVAKSISDFTDVEKEFIKQNLIEFKKHINLKQDSKIIVINEEKTILPPSFNKVMSLFPNKEKMIEVGGLDAILKDSYIEILKGCDLVVIENQVFNNMWYIKNQKIKTEYTNEKKELIKQGNEKVEDNIQNLVKLANKICKDTAIVYYGKSNDGFFPTDSVKEEYQENITFANAPSQLYGNILNMLKYKSETKL